jgi:hypothetical protein
MPRILLAYSTEEINQTGYQCIVEVLAGRGLSGSRKREYQKQFTSVERETIQRLYRDKLYSWMLRAGVPEEVVLHPKTYALLCKAAGFFAGS